MSLYFSGKIVMIEIMEINDCAYDFFLVFIYLYSSESFDSSSLQVSFNPSSSDGSWSLSEVDNSYMIAWFCLHITYTFDLCTPTLLWLEHHRKGISSNLITRIREKMNTYFTIFPNFLLPHTPTITPFHLLSMYTDQITN